MNPLTDQDMRDRLAAHERQVTDSSNYRAQWQAEKTYWDGKAQVFVDNSETVPEPIQKQQATADRTLLHADQQLAAATADRDDLLAALVAAKVVPAPAGA